MRRPSRASCSAALALAPTLAHAAEPMPVGLEASWPLAAQLVVLLLALIGVGALVTGGRDPRPYEGLVAFAAAFFAALGWAADGTVVLPLAWLAGILLGVVATVLYFTLGNVLEILLALLLHGFASRGGVAGGLRQLVVAAVAALSGVLAGATQHAWPPRVFVGAAVALAVLAAASWLAGERATELGRRLRVASLPARTRLLARGVLAGAALVLLYGGYRLWRGHIGFGSDDPAPALLLGAGIVTTLCWPRFGARAVSATLGAVLVCLPWGMYERFWPIVTALVVGLALQSFLPADRRRSDGPSLLRPDWDPPLEMGKILALPVGAAAATWLVIALLAPLVRVPSDSVYAARFARVASAVAADGAAPVHAAVGLLHRTGDVVYLTGRHHRIALVDVGPDAGWWRRLHFLVLGRSLSGATGDVRAVKEAPEQDALERAAAATSRVFARIAPRIAPGVNEAAIADAVVEAYRDAGVRRLSFRPIVGAGAHAALPHYQANDAPLRDGLVVIDIGGHVDGYASDMTRTFPVAGSFTDEERALVETVLRAQEASRAACRDGATLSELDHAARDVIERAGHGDAFVHGIGHHVGLEVHDPHADELATGMVITLEPGIYLLDRELGARIEDTLVVEDDGCRTITAFPRAPDAIEEAMRGRSGGEPPAEDAAEPVDGAEPAGADETVEPTRRAPPTAVAARGRSGP